MRCGGGGRCTDRGGNFVGRAPIGDADIGRRVRALRQAIGLSAVDLAKALGVTVSAVKELESGRATRQFVQLREMAVILQTTPNVILGLDENAATSPQQLDMMGAAVQVMLMDDGWPRERAEALVDIATEVAIEKTELDLDRRLAAAFRKRALQSKT